MRTGDTYHVSLESRAARIEMAREGVGWRVDTPAKMNGNWSILKLITIIFCDSSVATAVCSFYPTCSS